MDGRADGRADGQTDGWMGVADTRLWLVSREILPKPKWKVTMGQP